MPAVTVDDVLALPRIAEPPASTPGWGGVPERPVVSVTTAPASVEGAGFPIRDAFAGVDLALLDPFVMLHQAGAVEWAPGEATGAPWHPHRGVETVTYQIDGAMKHRDSLGNRGEIGNGDTQWMTAGAGILHVAEPSDLLVHHGGTWHGAQLWVNLPAARKWIPPSYQDIRGDRMRLLTSADGGALVRVVAGELPVRAEGDGASLVAGPGTTQTPIVMLHATLAPGAQVRLPWRKDFNALAYVLSGTGTVGAEARPLGAGQLAVFGAGEAVTVAAARRGPDSRTPSLDLLLLGGTPLREPIVWHGPFVMNTPQEIVQAFDDYQHGRLGQPLP